MTPKYYPRRSMMAYKVEPGDLIHLGDHSFTVATATTDGRDMYFTAEGYGSEVKHWPQKYTLQVSPLIR